MQKEEKEGPSRALAPPPFDDARYYYLIIFHRYIDYIARPFSLLPAFILFITFCPLSLFHFHYFIDY
jgi:hypothetical protein